MTIWELGFGKGGGGVGVGVGCCGGIEDEVKTTLEISKEPGSPAGYVRAIQGRSPTSFLKRIKQPHIILLRVVRGRANPNRMPRHDDDMAEDRGRGGPLQQSVLDASKMKERVGDTSIT